MKTLASDILKATSKLNQTGTWVRLFDVEIDSVTTLHLTNNTKNVLYNNITYIRYPIRISDVDETSKPEMKVFEVIVANIDRQVSSYLEAGKLLDKKVTITTIFIKSIIPSPAIVTAPVLAVVSSWLPIYEPIPSVIKKSKKNVNVQYIALTLA